MRSSIGIGGSVLACVCVSAGALVVVAAALPSAEGGWFSGQLYSFCASGGLYTQGYTTRVFGGLPTLVGSGTLYGYRFWDAEDTVGLAPGQVRLTFYMTDLSPLAGTLSGPMGGMVNLQFQGPSMPSGATFLTDTGRITFGFPDGMSPVQYRATDWPSGVFYSSGMADFRMFYWPQTSGPMDPVNHFGSMPTNATFEIVVDNVPEPLTIGLFAGGVLVVGCLRRRIPRGAAGRRS